MRTTTKKMLITKELNILKSELNDRLTASAKGWNIYLGDPIDPQIRDLKIEIFRLENTYKSL